MSKSVERVRKAASRLGAEITVLHMPESTRTALDAAKACGCDVGQIVKSLIFEEESSGDLKLLLVSGRNNVNLEKAAAQFGGSLVRASPRTVRDKTGFAIGGVAPIGHITVLDTRFDADLMRYEKVWAAAGAPDAVFGIAPAELLRITDARLFEV
jgi:prolyl-tRNA editing enzyme YbaK/EbsC (Cys-tRNA(Pro) deacylase)